MRRPMQHGLRFTVGIYVAILLQALLPPNPFLFTGGDPWFTSTLSMG